MSKNDDKGYIITPLSQIITDVKTIFTNAFIGIDIDNESPMGQVAIAIANKFDELQKSDSQPVYNSFDLDATTGNDLDTIGKLIGVQRDSLVPTVANTTFTSSSTGYIITAGTQFVLNSDNSTLFEILNDVTIDSLSKAVSLSSVETAEFDIVIGDTLSSLTSIPELSNIVVDGFTSGFDKETDFSYRTNLKLVRAGLGESGTERANRKILELDNVSSAIILDKNTDNTLLLGHILAVVEGGDNIDIATSLNKNRDMGIITDGAITEAVLDENGNSVNISFDRPTTLIATFQLEINLITSITQQNREDIVTAFNVLTQQTKIGGTLYYQDFYGAIVSIITGTSKISSLTINAGVVDIVAGQKEKIVADGTIDPNTNITIV